MIEDSCSIRVWSNGSYLFETRSMHAEKLIVMLNCSPCVVDAMTHNESFYLELKLVKKQLFVTLGPWGTVTRGLRHSVETSHKDMRFLFLSIILAPLV